MSKNVEKLGEKIEGSKFIRVFCNICNTPMRTTIKEVGDEHLCELCSPKHKGCNSPIERLHPGQKETIGLTMKRKSIIDRFGNKTYIDVVQDRSYEND